MAINKSSWYELGHFVIVLIILIQVVPEILEELLEILERGILYGENFILFVFIFFSSLWTVILIGKFLGNRLYQYIWLMYLNWPPKTEILEI